MKKAMKKAKEMSTKIATGAAAVGTAVVCSSPAQAALDISTLTVDKTDFETIATFLITALVGFWGIKKGLSLLGGR